MRGATLFSGGGGVESLLKQRIDFVHAVEYDPAIAAVYRQNHGDHIQVARVEDVDYSAWGALDYLHASPVCKNASQAKTGGVEGDGDLSSAQAVVRCLQATQPRVFTLENVWGYRDFAAFKLICQALDRGGYMWHYEHLNAADYGVPQTRRRLILRAVRDSLLPGWPAPMPWVGWYAAIEDLIPTLPASQFAPWQLARLPEGLVDSALVGDGDMWRPIVMSMSPSPTISSANGARAFLMRSGNTQQEWGDGGTNAVTPAYTVTSDAPPRAWLVQCRSEGQEFGKGYREEADPSFVIDVNGAKPKAWLASGRVVKMTPRALARFQSFPDSYILPDRPSLACVIIGNAAPPLLMKQVVEPLL